MSCGGNCNCGSSCTCGNGCGKMYADVEKVTSVTIIEGVAPKKTYSDENAEKSFGAEGGHGCKCGANCKCDPCTC
ncbi:unnamed protein product [Coffea canephora]|uniref:Metallothionein-like protein n=3 Tax=Coffea TaxID=13442 RepID=A0A068TXU6_COFCA|nr:unnamed protein product [Coffea canephora]